MDKEVYKYIREKYNDKIIEWKKCKISSEEFAIFESDKKFYEKISPVFPQNGELSSKNGEIRKFIKPLSSKFSALNSFKYLIPTPSLSPEERQRRRLAYRNDRNLYSSKCALSGKSIITIYNPEIHKNIYSIKSWWSDKWDPMNYSKNFDETKSFFEQYFKLHSKVPKIAMMNDNGTNSENIEYCQDVAYSKNCYLTNVAWKLENCHYNSYMAGGKWLIDCFFVMESENCYECLNSYNLFNCFFVENSRNISDCWFAYDLIGCNNCLFSVGLRNKKYYIFNKEYSKEEYFVLFDKFKKQLKDNISNFKKDFDNFLAKFPRRQNNNISCENSVGDNLINSKNSIFCYNGKKFENSKYWWFGDTGEYGVDLSVGGELKWCYEGITPDHSYKACFTIYCWSCTNVWYSEMCHNCSDCFGCVGLRNKKYCILNKQYEKDEYEKLVPNIIEHMIRNGERGEFFPIKYSPFAYNETVAMDYFGIKEDEAKDMSYKWIKREFKTELAKGVKELDLKKANNGEYSDEYILNNMIKCEVSGRFFKLIPDELKFYKKFSLPIPKYHPDIRFEKRFNRMPKKTQYLRNCKISGEKILSIYDKKSDFDVYSNEEYERSLYESEN